MDAIYKGKRYRVGDNLNECELEGGPTVDFGDPDLIVDPTDDEVDGVEWANPALDAQEAEAVKAIVGKVQTWNMWAVGPVGSHGPAIMYFPPTEDGTTEARAWAEDHGGVVAWVTIKGEVIKAEKDGPGQAKQAWVDGGMEGPCPECGLESGFHTDEGECEDGEPQVFQIIKDLQNHG